MGDKKPLPDWAPTRDPKRNAQIEREVQADMRREAEAKAAHRRKLDEMRPILADRRTRCAAILGALVTDSITRKNNWQNTIIDFTGAYLRAFNKFAAVFGEAEKQNAQSWAIAFTALSACTMGGIAALTNIVGGKLWEKDKAKDILIASVGDSFQAVAGGLLGMAQTAVAS